jgi:hypothetical protein
MACTPGVVRAHITESQLQDVKGSVESYTALPFTRDYLAQCDESVVDFFQKNICLCMACGLTILLRCVHTRDK